MTKCYHFSKMRFSLYEKKKQEAGQNTSNYAVMKRNAGMLHTAWVVDFKSLITFKPEYIKVSYFVDFFFNSATACPVAGQALCFLSCYILTIQFVANDNKSRL